MFFIIRFIIVWIIWFIFADKKRWKELFPVAVFAGLLGSTTDNLMIYYKLWGYMDAGLPTPILKMMDDWGIYLVVTYLFIQWLPKKKTFKNMILYWFIWTSTAVIVEVIHLETGHMEYQNFWNLGYSYISDWILFWIFYKLHGVITYKK